MEKSIYDVSVLETDQLKESMQMKLLSILI